VSTDEKKLEYLSSSSRKFIFPTIENIRISKKYSVQKFAKSFVILPTILVRGPMVA
jgi:hypothetical protein